MICSRENREGLDKEGWEVLVLWSLEFGVLIFMLRKAGVDFVNNRKGKIKRGRNMKLALKDVGLATFEYELPNCTQKIVE